MKTKIFLLSIILIICGIFTSCSDDEPDYDNFGSLSSSDQDNVIENSGTTLSMGMATALSDMQISLQSEIPSGGGGGSVYFETNASYECNISYPAMGYDCTGSGTVEGPAGGTASYTGQITGTIDNQEVSINPVLDFSFNAFAQEYNAGLWSITGNISAEGTGIVDLLTSAPSSMDLNFTGNIDTSTPYGVFNCDINVDYIINGTTASLSGLWCGYEIDQEFAYYTAY